MRRICIITTSHGRNDIRMYQKQAVSLAAHDFNVYYVVADGQPDEIKGNIVLTSFGVKERGKIDRLLFLSRRLYDSVLRINADVYQICDPELIPLGIKLKNKGKTVIFDSVEDWEGYYAGMYHGVVAKIMSKTMTFVLKHYLNRFDLVLVMSPNILKRLNRYAPNKVKMVSNYPITKGMQNQIINSKEQYLTNKNNFIYCGSVYDFSEQETIVNAIKKQKTEPAKYIIVGSIPDDRKESLSELSQNGHLELIPWVKKEELLKLYNSSICGVVIFDYTPVCCNKEGQMGSNKIFEYMMQGLPVICTDFDLWKSLIVDKYKCGICVNPKSEEQLADAIGYILAHKKEAYEMGQRGRNAVLNEFNWESQAKIYLRLYDELISSMK